MTAVSALSARGTAALAGAPSAPAWSAASAAWAARYELSALEIASWRDDYSWATATLARNRHDAPNAATITRWDMDFPLLVNERGAFPTYRHEERRRIGSP